MKTRIACMLRFGTKWTVVLECGHTFPCSGDYAKQHQLFIGKAITCEQKHKETTK